MTKACIFYLINGQKVRLSQAFTAIVVLLHRNLLSARH
jgi:hypothetical protein